ncbi:MAG: FecR domain-containing protein [Chitinophagaceae bacterium]
MTEEKLWLLVSLQLSGEATPAELEDLELLLQQDPRLQARVDVLTQAWYVRNHGSKPGAQTAMGFDKHLQRLSNHLAAPALQFESAGNDATEPMPDVIDKSRMRYKWLWATGSIAACAVIIFLFVRTPATDNSAKQGTASNSISTKPGSKSKIVLPDGTQVWLNADSKIEYNGNLSGKYREVSLSGEAYFDVVKDKSRPFIIHTNTIQIKVLGTAFNVRSYPADKTTETALIRGSVEVTLNAQPDKKVILKPNEKVVVVNATAEKSNQGGTNAPKAALPEETMVVGNVHLDKKDQEVYETMWVKNKLAFDEAPFDNMIAEIERWYNVVIVVKNKNLSTGTYTFTFENKTLDEVLEGLQFSAHFQYQLKNGVVTIW